MSGKIIPHVKVKVCYEKLLDDSLMDTPESCSLEYRNDSLLDSLTGMSLTVKAWVSPRPSSLALYNLLSQEVD